MNRHPSIENQKAYYDHRWPNEISAGINSIELRRLIAILQMIDQTQIKPGMRILDLGCGRGWLSSILSHIGATTGIELSDEAVRAARELHRNVDFRTGNLFEVLTERDWYDLVISQEVIEHVADQSAFINLTADSMKLGGFFIFTTPNAWTQAHRTREELENWGLQPIENWIDRRQITKLLARRFQVIEIKSIIDGFGATGVFRIASSKRLRIVLDRMKLLRLYSSLLLSLDFGLHLVVLAKRKL